LSLPVRARCARFREPFVILGRHIDRTFSVVPGGKAPDEAQTAW
jgi:hypothetical protein